MTVKHDTAVAVVFGVGVGLVLCAWAALDYVVRRSDFLFPKVGRLND